MGRNFQGVSKVNDKNETKTVNVICNGNEASCKRLLQIDQNKKSQCKMASWASVITRY